ncbi:FHA domain-containing protein [Singulisphaera sp. GP187]|uniref:FHA domain-containing protein n=1 Tax=Singulisphaera sp. GP187 TaxID=1882752 RepID=UPI0020B16F5A|nr:FHA domain-containing protein [Singulisphaera sp. GP187]
MDHPRVSRRQVYLQVIAGRSFHVNIGGRIHDDCERELIPQGWVDDQRGIEIGPVRIHTEDPASSVNLGNPLDARSLDDSPLPVVILEFPQQTGRPSWKLSRVLTLLGRTSECRLRFLDHEISHYHCSLLRTPSGTWVVDLLGRTGIKLNKQPIRWARLENGDLLEVGRHLIRIRCEMPAPKPSSQAIRTVSTVAVVSPRPGRPPTLLEIGHDLPQDPPFLAPTDRTESIIAYMANQFGQMQQQMLDQFQQAMVTMAQTLGSLHRDQMAQVRDELDQLRQLSQDLLILQSQAQANRGDPLLVALPPIRSTNGMVATDDAMSRVQALLQASLTAANSATPSEEDKAVTKPRSSTPPDDEPQHGAIKNGTSPKANPSSSKPTSIPTPSPAQVSADDETTAPTDKLPDDQIHSFLCQRMAKLQQERQGRWQKICDLMLGR